MISIAEQNVAEMGGHMSVLSRQKADHMKLDRLLHQLAATPASEQRTMLLKIYRLVFPHAFAEESVLWPVIRRVLPDGHQLTLQVEQEHQRINELVRRLETLQPGSAEHQQVLDEVVVLLREDVRDEEDALLPRLQAKLSPAQLRLLGIAWTLVCRISPTRAHPFVARRPPGNVLSALPLTVLDRSRDRVEALGFRRTGSARPVLRTVGAGLARTSRAVEHLPGMDRGEDPSTHIAERQPLPWTTIAVAGVAALSVGVALRSTHKRHVLA